MDVFLALLMWYDVIGNAPAAPVSERQQQNKVGLMAGLNIALCLCGFLREEALDLIGATLSRTDFHCDLKQYMTVLLNICCVKRKDSRRH